MLMTYLYMIDHLLLHVCVHTCACVHVRMPLCCLLLQSDPYIHIELGSTVIKDSKSYVPNELNPVFGR